MAVKEKKKTKQKNSVPLVIEDDLEKDVSLTERWIGALILLIVSLTIYVLTMFPGLPMGDSGEFMVTGIDFGVAHPPGYPIFTTLCYFAINGIPFGTPAWRVNLLSVIFGACFNVTVYFIVSKLGKNNAVAFLVAGWIGFSRLHWMWSIQGEIFSLNNFFCALIMLQTINFEYAKQENVFRQGCIGALLCGLSLGNQHTSVLFIFPIALRVLFVLVVKRRSPFRDLFVCGMHGVAGLSCYLQLPISFFFFKPRVTWGHHKNIENIVRHLLRLDYGSSFKLVAGDSQSTFLTNFFVFVRDSSSELTAFVWMLTLYGIVLIMNSQGKRRSTLTLFFSMLGCYLMVFCSLANIADPQGLELGVLERFWMQPSIVLVVMAGLSLCKLIELCNEKLPSFLTSNYLHMAIALLLVSVQIKRNYKENDESDNFYAYEYSQTVLPHLPENSIVLTGGDLPTNVFRYHTIAENYRTDVTVMDMQFMAAKWFKQVLGPVAFANVTIPGDPGEYRPFKTERLQEGYYNLDMFLDFNIDQRPIFICNNVRLDETSHEEKYLMYPFASCKRFKRALENENENPIEFLKTQPDVTLDNFPLPDITIYEDRTWEYSLAGIGLRALSDRSLFLWKLAKSSKIPSNRRYLLEHGVTTIRKAKADIDGAIKAGKLSEGVWSTVADVSKNAGHFCMMLIAMVPDDRKDDLEQCVRDNWQHYINWYPKGEKGDPFIKEMRNFLKMKSFRDLKFNM